MKGNISWSLWEFKINNAQNNVGFPKLIAILSLEVYGSSALRVTGLVTDIHSTCNYNQRQAGNEILDFRTRLDGCNCCTVSFFPPVSISHSWLQKTYSCNYAVLSRLHTNQGCGCVQIEQWQIFSGLRASARRNFRKPEWVLTDTTGTSPQRHESGTCGGCKGVGWAMNASIFSKYSRPNKPQGCCLYVFINCNCIVQEQTKSLMANTWELCLSGGN